MKITQDKLLKIRQAVGEAMEPLAEEVGVEAIVLGVLQWAATGVMLLPGCPTAHFNWALDNFVLTCNERAPEGFRIEGGALDKTLGGMQ